MSPLEMSYFGRKLQMRDCVLSCEFYFVYKVSWIRHYGEGFLTPTAAQSQTPIVYTLNIIMLTLILHYEVKCFTHHEVFQYLSNKTIHALHFLIIKNSPKLESLT